MKDKSWLDFILERLFEFAVITFCFIMGAIVIRYNLPPSRALVNGFIAAEAYLAAAEDGDFSLNAGKRIP